MAWWERLDKGRVVKYCNVCYFCSYKADNYVWAGVVSSVRPYDIQWWQRFSCWDSEQCIHSSLSVSEADNRLSLAEDALRGRRWIRYKRLSRPMSQDNSRASSRRRSVITPVRELHISRESTYEFFGCPSSSSLPFPTGPQLPRHLADQTIVNWLGATITKALANWISCIRHLSTGLRCGRSRRNTISPFYDCNKVIIYCQPIFVIFWSDIYALEKIETKKLQENISSPNAVWREANLMHS